MVDRIKLLAKEKNVSISTIERSVGLGNGIIGKWKKQSPSCDRLKLVADYLNTTIDYLWSGEEKNSSKPSLDADEQELLNNFKVLSPFNKGKVIGTAKILAEIELEEKGNHNKKIIEQHTNPGYIESYTLPASAGTGVDLDACEKIILEVKDAELINGANFAVKISGDSMEPEFHNGQYALVKTKPQIEQGKIGIFTVNSDGYIKKLGAGELISLNPEYDNILLHEYDNVRCRGEVIGTLEPKDIISKEEY